MTLPRSAERGPIEARQAMTVDGARYLLPRSAERGPIEALTPAFALSKSDTHFHVQPNVAPLKRRRATAHCP